MRLSLTGLCWVVLLFCALPIACIETMGLQESRTYAGYGLIYIFMPPLLFFTVAPTLTALCVAPFVEGPRHQTLTGFGCMGTFCIVLCVAALTVWAVTEATNILYGLGAAYVYGNVALMVCLIIGLHFRREVEPPAEAD
ncbi:hypothetical protein [Myxococcus qinghaiensis]|uniref:hypothetical protein n=1 Tax=Myxococcus qinghaiensis TaxID=2906758 RepID=UPI0020A73C5C|nr:hypothetical protein [Myxococcus qinghaiensis]MCP3168038.1 hypothetical protein [Myxococcus qinghaiensis]